MANKERWNPYFGRWETVSPPDRETSPAPKAPTAVMQTGGLMPPSSSSRGWVNVFDTTPGVWQADGTSINSDRVLAHWAVYACLSLIAQDVGKLHMRLVEEDKNGIWTKARSAAFSPVLRRPNRYQTFQQFIEHWVLSKLGPAGNTYVLKIRDARGIVIEMHVLDPYMTVPLIAPDGSVFYDLGQDPLTRVGSQVRVPASEIIHDRAACLRHPLVGISPIYACGLPAMQGLQIQQNSESFFRNRSMPGGVITAPTEITQEMAELIKSQFNARYSGENAGKTAVLGDGLKYEPHAVNARDSQLTEQLSLTAKMVCSAYHVPPFKIGLESLPAGQKVEDMNRIYYQDCLQTLIESIEALLDYGLGLDLTGRALGTEFDLDDLLRMDLSTLVSSLSAAVAGTIMSPNEARARMNLPPVEGGEAPLSQQQNWTLEQLSHRSAPTDSASVSPPPAEDPEDDTEEDDTEEDDASAVETEIESLARLLPPLVKEAA